MCGIAGFVGRLESGEQVLKRMMDRLVHRGPDGEGTYFGDAVGLGHRRLRVVDLDTGDQPMANEDGTVLVVFNGEIYNYRELRESLIRRGHTFRTRSDTETILHLYEDYGADCLSHLSGMFAFAIWDETKRELFIARDRVGVKPLVYCQTNQAFLFSSEVASLTAAGTQTTTDPEALFRFLTLGYVPAPGSVYLEVRKLEPGSYLIVGADGRVVIRRQYWSPLAGVVDGPLEGSAAVSGLRVRVREAVRDRLVSDVPLGALLSGGLDSSIVVGLMRSEFASGLRTFSATFPGESGLDEEPYAKSVADHFNTRHRVFAVTSEELLAVVPEVLDKLGEPFAGGTSLLPTFLVSRLARTEVTVALSGDGADELLAGYRKYLGERYARRLQALPGWAVEALRGSARLLERLGAAPHRMREMSRFLGGLAPTARERHARWMCSADIHAVGEILGMDVREPWQKLSEEITAIYDHYSAVTGTEDPVNAGLYTDYRFVLPNDILTKVDLASMYNSLEVRSPFLDYRVAEVCFRMPGSLKLRGGTGKAVLRDAFKDLVPRVIQRRRKQGFDAPIGTWLKGPLREQFFDQVASTDLVRGDVVRRLYNDHEGGADHTKLLWSVFVLAAWAERQG